MYPLANLRKFHNAIKRDYINKYAKENTKLLDLAVGKGGDLHKWLSNDNIISVDGLDINQDSIKEAIKRRDNVKNLNKPINFYVKDLSDSIINCKQKYSMINVMFAFHYFFRDKFALDNITNTIFNCSKRGSILIMTLFNGDLINSLPKNGIETKDFYIRKISLNKRGNYGNPIEVYTRNAVLDIPDIEYVVKPSFLYKKMEEIGFKPVENVNFSELYQDKYKLSDDEKKFSFLNNVYVFKKE